MPKLTLSPHFKRVLAKKSTTMQAAILACIQQLGDNPRHPGLNAHRMQGAPGVWEAYVDRANRVTYQYERDGSITLRMNCNHDMLRRNP